jgi:hypothetical protein
VARPLSIAIANSCGRRSRSSRSSMATVPFTAWVGSPDGLESGAIAWYARRM